jgi:hypothetical protein
VKRVIVAIVCGVWACSDDRAVLTGALPETTRYVAAVIYDGEGAPIAGTPLSPYVAGKSIEVSQSGIESDPETGALYAWDEGVIPADLLFARDDSPVALADPTDPILPAPSWYGVGSVVGDRTDVDPLEVAPELTAPWLPRCPLLLPSGSRIYADIRCVPRRCLARAPSQSGCAIVHDLEPCGLGAVGFAVDGRGVLRPATDFAMLHCEAAIGPPEAAIAYACMGCRVDVYVEPAIAPERPFELGEVDLYPGLPVLEENDEPDFDGYLGDLAIVGEQLVVSSYDGSTSEDACREAARASRLHFLDRQTFEIVRTATAAGCLKRIAGDPFGAGVYATDGPGRTLYRFDANGRVLEQADLPLPQNRGVSELSSFADPPRLWLGLRGREGVGSIIRVFDEDLETPLREVPNREKLRTLVAGPSGIVAAGYDGLLDFMAIGTGEVVGSVNVGTGTGIGNEAHALVFVPGADRYLVIDGTDNSGIHVSSMAMTGAATIEYAHDAILTGGVAWPPDPGLALIGFFEREAPHRAFVALFDGRSSHFLPDTWEIGTGPVLGMTADDRGRIYAILPSLGRVVRLTTRP